MVSKTVSLVLLSRVVGLKSSDDTTFCPTNGLKNGDDNTFRGVVGLKNDDDNTFSGVVGLKYRVVGTVRSCRWYSWVVSMVQLGRVVRSLSIRRDIFCYSGGKMHKTDSS